MQANGNTDIGQWAGETHFKLPARSGFIDPSLYWWFFQVALKGGKRFRNPMKILEYGEVHWIEVKENESGIVFAWISSTEEDQPDTKPGLESRIMEQAARANLGALTSGQILFAFQKTAIEEIRIQLGLSKSEDAPKLTRELERITVRSRQSKTQRAASTPRSVRCREGERQVLEMALRLIRGGADHVEKISAALFTLEVHHNAVCPEAALGHSRAAVTEEFMARAYPDPNAIELRKEGP